VDPEDRAAAAAADATADSLAAVLLLGKAAGLLTDTLPVLAAKTLFKVKGVIIPLVTLVVATVEVILALLLTMMVDCIELTLLATDLEEVDVMAKDLPRISAISLSGLLMIC